MVEAYWNVGREIVEKQGGKRHAKYGDALVKTLATRLTADFGAGFTAANLFNMRQYYLDECVKSQIKNMRLFLMELGRGFALDAAIEEVLAIRK